MCPAMLEPLWSSDGGMKEPKNEDINCMATTSLQVNYRNCPYRNCSPLLIYTFDILECNRTHSKTIVSRNHQRSRENNNATIFELVLRGFVRRNFIGHHGWNGQESTNQLRQHISDMEYVHVFLVLSFGVEDGPKRLP